MKKLLIIETINNMASEGIALEQGLKLMLDYTDQRTGRHLKISPCKTAFKKSDFLKLIKKDVDYLHISAHGEIENLEIGRQEKRGKILKKGDTVTAEEIENTPVKAKNIFVSACFGGHKKFFEAFFSDKRDGVYIGPCRKVPFDEAFLTALNFHRGIFVDQSLSKGISYIKKDNSVKSSYQYFKSPKHL